MHYLVKENKKKELLVYSLVYTAAQWILLVASGWWWDDWGFYNQPFETCLSCFTMTGTPQLAYLHTLLKMAPRCTYRILTFILFYWCGLFLYRILKEWFSTSDKACMWIILLYAIIPANDARITQICFPYTLCLFLFMLGTWYLAIALNKPKLTWKDRIICYVLFFCSFSTNSILVFYGMNLLMIIIKKIKTEKLKGLIKYIDFVILPILFFAQKNMLFPVSGLYSNYNIVTVKEVLKAIAYCIPADCVTILLMFFYAVRCTYKVCGKLLLVALVSVLFVAMNAKKIVECVKLCFKLPKKNEVMIEGTVETDAQVRENVILLIAGIISLTAGLFAYVTIRGGMVIVTKDVGGRDSLLTAMGVALILYAGCNLLLKKWIRKFVLTCILLCGVCYFNFMYVAYQEDYYKMLGFEYQLTEHSEIKDCHNIIYVSDEVMEVNCERFYTLNAMSVMAYGIDDKLIYPSYDDAAKQLGEDMSDFVKFDNYHMGSYDYTDRKVDAVIEYDFDADYVDTLELKFLEIFNYSAFESKLQSYTSANVYLDGDEKFESLLEENGIVNE